MNVSILDKLFDVVGTKGVCGTLLIVVAAALYLCREVIRLRKDLALARQEQAKVPKPGPTKKAAQAGNILFFGIPTERVVRGWSVGLDFTHLMRTAFKEIFGFTANMFAAY